MGNDRGDKRTKSVKGCLSAFLMLRRRLTKELSQGAQSNDTNKLHLKTAALAKTNRKHSVIHR